jgi:hypothetical protein
MENRLEYEGSESSGAWEDGSSEGRDMVVDDPRKGGGGWGLLVAAGEGVPCRPNRAAGELLQALRIESGPPYDASSSPPPLLQSPL